MLYQFKWHIWATIKEKISNTFFNTEIYHGNYNNLKWNYIIGREQEAILSCGTKIQLGTPIIKIIADNNAFANTIFTNPPHKCRSQLQKHEKLRRPGNWSVN